MRVLGIDPGTLTTGYGVLDQAGSGLTLVDCGAISPKAKDPIEKRLVFLYHGLVRVIKDHRPDEVAVEDPFVSENIQSALALGRAQAIAMLAAADAGLPVFRYSPAQAKQQVTGYGNSTKLRVQEMVKILVGIQDISRSTDATDALAIAICHLNQTHLSQLLRAAGGKGS
jgi:crossover junction endodeoxyribonuclease RuvC